MAEWYHTLQDAIVTHAGEWWTYLATGLLCWLDGFFPPVPSESIVIAMSALSETHGGPVQLWLVILTACAGAFAGDNTAYLIGRHIPLDKIFRGERGTRTLIRAHDLMHRKGAVMLMSARFIPGYRIAMNMVAGFVRFPHRRFMVIDAVATLMWGALSVGIGLAAGSLFHDRPLLGIIIGIALGLVIGYLIERGHAWRERRHAARHPGEGPRGTVVE
ncbi:MAG: DedA family protein [Propioniciclava sp.]|uniref:DedA family protein n=1 Tax=Propioniciclava sp. TaxID=2038686 RepID=UPI0039E5DB91